MTVVICAEKPDQAKKISAPFPNKKYKDHIAIEPCSVFPKGAIVISACGHLLELFAPGDYEETLKEWNLDTIPIMPKEYKLKVIESKRFYFNAFKKYVKDPNISIIINAGDPEVEGQLLIDEILYFLNNKKPVKRLWTSSLTKDSIIKAFQNLKDNKDYLGYYNAALARQRSDWLIGINSSRTLTILLNQKGIHKTFSAGRVQSSLVGLIYQREVDIEKFVSQSYWDCWAEFDFGGEKIVGKWFNDKNEHIFDNEVAKALIQVCKDKPVEVFSISKEEKRIRPPLFYSLSTLQMEANKLYGMSPADVLSFAQALYEKSLISYPRSSSTHITPEEAKWMPTILKNLRNVEGYKQLMGGATRDITTDKRFVDSSKVSDHYGIILTEDFVNPSSLPKGEAYIYDLIAKSVIAAHYTDYVYSSSEIITVVQGRFTFKSKGKQEIEPGWKSVYQLTKSEQSPQEEENGLLPELSEGQLGQINLFELKEGATKPPARFSQGDLIRIMSNAAHYLKDKEDFKNSELSLGTEATRASIVQTITSRYVKIHQNLVYLQPEGRVFMEAVGQDSYLTSVLTTGRMERYLDAIKNGKGTVKDFVQKTEQITQLVTERLKKDASIWNFEHYAKEIQKSEEIGTCKLCGEVVIDKGTFYGCSGYKVTKCPFTIPKKISGKNIGKDNAKKLLETGTTALIKGFQNKKNETTFDAILVWNADKKSIQFSKPG